MMGWSEDLVRAIWRLRDEGRWSRSRPKLTLGQVIRVDTNTCVIDEWNGLPQDRIEGNGKWRFVDTTLPLQDKAFELIDWS